MRLNNAIQQRTDLHINLKGLHHISVTLFLFNFNME
jgi:hypothetical protein